jgi:lysozyme family protein
MPTAFDAAFTAVLGAEGGYVNNPADPGGETNWGISRRSYPDLDIAHLTWDDAKAIYRRDFWDKIQGDKLPPPLAMIVFDSAVNNGPARAAKWLQRAVGVTEDGIIGPATLAADCEQADSCADRRIHGPTHAIYVLAADRNHLWTWLGAPAGGVAICGHGTRAEGRCTAPTAYPRHDQRHRDRRPQGA